MSKSILKGNLPALLAEIPDINLDVISMSTHLTEHHQANRLVGSLGLVGFDEPSVELVRSTLDIKTDVVRHNNEALEEDIVYVVRADIQEARMLIPRLVHKNLARLICRGVEPSIPHTVYAPQPRRTTQALLDSMI